ncbi:MAG: double-strand break repair helicase AddA, partial [Alphaproteobacteria bacterium]|nr:double-strand break repair helicase AddA [Alphaproteobacteria bacterium]
PATRPLAPSRLGEEPAVLSPAGADDVRFRRGRIVHRLLQLLPELPVARRAAAARRFLADPAHGLDATAREALAAEVLAVLADAAFAPIFAPGSRAEVPIAGLVGQVAVSGQIDRLAIGSEEILAVDFKTNRAPPAAPETAAPAYLAQMAAYRALLRRAFPGRRVRTALVWTDGPRLMALPDALLDRHLPARLDSDPSTT